MNVHSLFRWWFDKDGNGPASWPLCLVIVTDIVGLVLIVLGVRFLASVW